MNTIIYFVKNRTFRDIQNIVIKIKRTKSRLKRSIKRLLNRSEKIPYVHVKQKKVKS